MGKIVNMENLPDVFNVGDTIRNSRGAITRRMLNYAINKMLKERKLFKISNGTYSKTANVFYIACTLYNGYIGLSSALYLHGLKTEVEPNIYVCTKRHEGRIKVLDKIIVPVNVSNMHYGTVIAEQGGKDLLVSSYPKTIFDMISNPGYSNYFDMYRALHGRKLNERDLEELLYYAEHSSLTDLRRVGYALDGMTPSWFTSKLHSKSKKGRGVSYFFKHRNINFNAKWGIYDSINISRWKDVQ